MRNLIIQNMFFSSFSSSFVGKLCRSESIYRLKIIYENFRLAISEAKRGARSEGHDRPALGTVLTKANEKSVKGAPVSTTWPTAWTACRANRPMGTKKTPFHSAARTYRTDHRTVAERRARTIRYDYAWQRGGMLAARCEPSKCRTSAVNTRKNGNRKHEVPARRFSVAFHSCAGAFNRVPFRRPRTSTRRWSWPTKYFTSYLREFESLFFIISE